MPLLGQARKRLFHLLFLVLGCFTVLVLVLLLFLSFFRALPIIKGYSNDGSFYDILERIRNHCPMSSWASHSRELTYTARIRLYIKAAIFLIKQRTAIKFAITY